MLAGLISWSLALALAGTGVILAYAWGIYPFVLMVIASKMKGASINTSASSKNGAASRSVSIIFSAHNEESCIAKRLDNLLILSGHPDEFSIHVGVDGSTDRTVAIAGEYSLKHQNIHVHEFKERSGKVAVLKELVKQSDGNAQKSEYKSQTADILVFTDANTRFREDALARLLAPFSDESVGGVCGRLIFTGGESEGSYWQWETRLKMAESALDSCLGANGAIYAIRRELFWSELSGNTVVDDFVIGMKVREQGYRMIYEPEAVAEEESPETRHEWRRRVRIGSGDFQALGFCRRCLSPRFGRFAWMFWSHKVLRWFTPHMIIVMLACCLASVRWPALSVGEGSVFRVQFIISAFVLAGMALLLVFSVFGRLSRKSSLAGFRFLRLCNHFVTKQAALFVGFIRYCRGNLAGQWERTPRSE